MATASAKGFDTEMTDPEYFYTNCFNYQDISFIKLLLERRANNMQDYTVETWKRDATNGKQSYAKTPQPHSLLHQTRASI